MRVSYVAACAAVGVAALLVGCGSSFDKAGKADSSLEVDASQPNDATPKLKPGPWVDFGCDGDPSTHFAGLEFNSPIDSIALFIERAGEKIAIGQRCGGASDVDRCEQAFEAILAPSDACAADTDECVSFFVTTRDDEVTRSDDRADLIALLAPIDTAAKAVLVVRHDGINGSGKCGVTRFGEPFGLSTRAADDGFYVRNRWYTFEHGIFCDTFHVAADGTRQSYPAKSWREPSHEECFEPPVGP